MEPTARKMRFFMVISCHTISNPKVVIYMNSKLEQTSNSLGNIYKNVLLLRCNNDSEKFQLII